METQKEIWKDVSGHSGYEVSNFGRVKSLARVVMRSDGNKYSVKERVLKTGDNGSGYLQVALDKKSRTVHQLVAIAFLNHKPDGTMKTCVDHIDNNKLNNRADNLQLISARENTSKDKKGGSSEYVGVCWDKSSSKWHSRIRINSKRKYLGSFTNELDAAEAYQNALTKLK